MRSLVTSLQTFPVIYNLLHQNLLRFQRIFSSAMLDRSTEGASLLLRMENTKSEPENPWKGRERPKRDHHIKELKSGGGDLGNFKKNP